MKTDSEQKGIVFDISRYCLDDGPGIRTTVFLKGCPLRCLWCHNPESNEAKIEYGRSGEETIQYGKEMSVNEVLQQVLRDRVFYETSGGGLTISGGEPLFQADFASALLKAAKEAGIHTCVETSGYGSATAMEKLLPYTDRFLFDCKETDPEQHLQETGGPWQVVERNLGLLNERGKEIVLRLPLIPGINDREDHFLAVGELADSLESVLFLEVMPYHPMGLNKAKTLGRTMGYDNPDLPKAEVIQEWMEQIQKYTSKEVKTR